MDGREVREDLRRYFAGCPFPVHAAYLFGSYARGHATSESDVDVAVWLQEPKEEDRAALCRAILSDLSRVLADAPVDICSLVDERDGFVGRVLREGEALFWRDGRARTRYETDAFLRAFDAESLDRLQTQYLAARIEAGRLGDGGPDMIDRDAVQDRLMYIDEMLRRLKRQRGISFEAFSEDETRSDASLYEMQTSLEAVSDIATHLAVGAGLGRPEGRAGAVHLLVRHGILPEELEPRLVAALGMRNVLVHGYLRLVLRMAYDAIQNNLGDIEAFCFAVQRYIEEHEDDAS